MRCRYFITYLFALVALISIATVFIPYTPLKSLADSIMSDGNFKSLNESNAIIFRIILGVVGLFFIVASIVIGGGYLDMVLGWLHQYYIDMTIFIKGLKPTKFDIFPLVTLLLVLGSAVILRLVYINEQISHDEGYTFVVFGSTSIFNIVSNYHLPNNHVLNSLLIFFSTHLFGSQPWAVRLPALSAGLLLIPATFALAKQIYDKYTAFLSAILITILPGAILYSTTARGYSLVALFTVLTLLIAYYLRENKNLFAWSLLVLFSALGFYSVPVMLFPFGVVFVWLFLENLLTPPRSYGSKFIFLKYWVLAGISTATLVLILYIPIFIYSGTEKVFANQWVSPEPWLGYISAIPSRLLNVWHEWTGGLPFIWLILLVVGFCLSLVFHRRIARNRVPLQIAAFLWIALLILFRRPEGVTKIWAFLQAPFVIWSASGIMLFIKDLRIKFAKNLSVASIVVSVILLITLVDVTKLSLTIHDRWNQKGPEEKTVLAIKDQLNTNDLIIIDPPYDAGIWYYSKIYGLSGNNFNKYLPFNQLFVIVSPSMGQTLQSVLQSRGPDPHLTDLEAAHLTINYGYLDTYIVPHR
ncbi:MAG: glycosyltransferase family 39 protein [Anaerolineales bacterium]